MGDLTNPQRSQIYDTLSIPPSQLPKNEFVSWCHGTLGRAHKYTFLAFLKEQKIRQLFLTCAGEPGDAVEDLGERLEGFAVGGGGGGGSPYAPRAHEEAEEGEEPSPVPFKGDRRLLQGGSHQEGARDLYTTHEFSITPLLPVLAARVKEGKPMLIWEPCHGLGNIAKVLAEAGFSVVGTDLYAPDGTIQPEQSFIDCVVEGKALAECAVPEGVTHIVTNPPFSEKLAFIKRFYALGLPTYCLLPVDTLGVKGCSKLFEDHGVELFFMSGKASNTFYKVSEEKDVNVGACAWFAFNTRTKKGENFHHFL